MKDILKEKLIEFIERFESESIETKKLVHYNSTINISNQIIKFNNSTENDEYRKLISKYLDVIKLQNPYFDKGTSLELYNLYILACGQHLIKKANFRDNTGNVMKYVLAGIIIDILIYIFLRSKLPLYFTIFTPLFFILGIRRRNKAKANKKAFGIGF